MDDEKITKKVRSDRFNNFIFSIIAVVCIVIIAVAVSPKTLQNDTFYNIKCGEYIFENGIFGIEQDPFSWQNLPYSWPHWLYDLLIFIFFAICGRFWNTRNICTYDDFSKLAWNKYLYNKFKTHKQK